MQKTPTDKLCIELSTRLFLPPSRNCSGVWFSHLDARCSAVIFAEREDSNTQGLYYSITWITATIGRTLRVIKTTPWLDRRQWLLAKFLFQTPRARSSMRPATSDLALYMKNIHYNMACMLGTYVDDSIATGPPTFDSETRVTEKKFEYRSR